MGALDVGDFGRSRPVPEDFEGKLGGGSCFFVWFC